MVIEEMIFIEDGKLYIQEIDKHDDGSFIKKKPKEQISATKLKNAINTIQ